MTDLARWNGAKTRRWSAVQAAAAVLASVPIQKFLCTLSVSVEGAPAEALNGRQNVVR
jgi:hypothetical protein